MSQPPVWRLLKQFRQEQTIKPKAHGGGQPAMLKDNDFQRIKQIIDQHSELTAEQILKKSRPATGAVSVEPSHSACSKKGLRWVVDGQFF